MNLCIYIVSAICVYTFAYEFEAAESRVVAEGNEASLFWQCSDNSICAMEFALVSMYFLFKEMPEQCKMFVET